MKWDRDKNPESRKGARFARAASALTAIFLVAGCSAVPDWANPVEWYDGAAGLISGDDETESKAAEAKPPAGKIPGEGKEFPNLASVPERPKAPSEEERKRLAASLNADRENARYSDETIKRQSAAPPPPAPRAPSTGSAAATAPSVPAVPQAPVVAAPPPPAPVVAARPASPAPRPVAPPPPTTQTTQTTQARAPLPGSSVLNRQPVSRPPQFAPRPPSPVMPSLKSNSGLSQGYRPSPSARSVARVGNPTFGSPPADIAAALGAGARPAPTGFSPQPQVPGTSSAGAPILAGNAAATVRFKAGSARLTAAGRREVRKIAGMYRQRGGAIRVEGHASSRTRNMDPVQHHLVNFNVSLNRANAVANELVRQGVPAQSVFVAAMSDSRPLFYEVMPAGDAGNQRVEIHFVN